MIYMGHYESPIGRLRITASDRAVRSIVFADDESGMGEPNDGSPLIEQAILQLDEYFAGIRKTFALPLELNGTEFQTRVWHEVKAVPCGETRSYRGIAADAGSEKAVRAVGNANGKNNLLIVIPCHRIVGSNGELTGYAGGLWRKEWLLNHEKKHAGGG